MGQLIFYRPQRSCGKVIFSQASVSHSVHGGGGVSASVQIHTPRQVHHLPGQVHPPGRYTPWAGTPPAGTPPGQVHPLAGTPLGRCTPWAGTHPRQVPPGRYTPSPHDGHCSGWYASYWNAFLKLIFLLVMVDMTIVTPDAIAHKPKQKCVVWYEYCSTCRDVRK